LIALFGSLSPDGAILKRAAADPTLFEHQGRAIVFDGLNDLAQRIDQPDLDVCPDDILVLKNAGPVAAGMPEAGYLPIPGKLARTGVKDMIRISDARMSGTAFGTIILHVTPESAVGGPLSLVKNGDAIRLSVRDKRLDLLVDETELSKRRTLFSPLPLPTRGWAGLYARSVQQAGLGCDFEFLTEAGFTRRPLEKADLHSDISR
jgi:dihydroxy-acid dehydratase